MYNQMHAVYKYAQLSIIAAVVSYCYSRVIVKHKVAKISRDWRLTEMLYFFLEF